MPSAAPILRRAALTVSLAAALLAALALPAWAAPAATHIVQLRAGVSAAAGRSAVRTAHGSVTGSLPIIRGLAVRLPVGGPAALRRDPRIAAVSLNARVRAQRSGVSAARLATAYPYSAGAAPAWPLATGRGVGVAVIDTGIDGTRRDFADATGASRVVASVVTNPDAKTAADTYGHGTHVAGIIAGDGNRRASGDPLAGKYVGVAPEANLVSIKAADDQGRGTVLDAIYGLQFVVEHHDDYNIRVVNLSLSSTVKQSYRTDPLDAAVEAAHFHGILVVAAAGNRGGAADAVQYAPGNDPFALTVGADDDQGTRTRRDDVTASWSSAGMTQDGFAKPELAAPGAHIVSTLAPGSAFASLCSSCITDGEYFRVGGTSMAAPVVSGAAALVYERHPTWTPDQVKDTLVATARAIPGGAPEVNAFAAITQSAPSAASGAVVEPNGLVDPADGTIDYARSSWGRSSWSGAPESLVADWARSSWSCSCETSADGSDAQGTRSSWGSARWLANWAY